MPAMQVVPQVLVGPRWLDDKVCRLVYSRATDEVWTEEWRDHSWIKTNALVRHVLKAPTLKPSQMSRRGIPPEIGVWDSEGACA
jgi:hypothetical protein